MPNAERDFDVIVVGGGHAGCEAALVAARMGAATALVSMDLDQVACMPCNPAIGGIAKSHLVSEVDALGGEIGRNADATGIQFRTLNTRKGPAVRANRVQCDKAAYSARMAFVVNETANLTGLEGVCEGLITSEGAVVGVELSDGSRLLAGAVVVTAGTFLRGRLHIGQKQWAGGRLDAPAADALSQSLGALGVSLSRLKTGTPPRLHRDSLDYTRMEAQPGQTPVPFFSLAARRGELFHVEHLGSPQCPFRPGSDQVPCHLTHTTPQTHALIAANLERSSLYGGAIQGTGVRYCPSIEDKVVKFTTKTSHHVFVEPEGRDSELIYPNGLSNSLPEAIQAEMVHSVPGLERAEIVRWGYAIEYDFADPRDLWHTLESKHVKRLFLAGQMNGTTGYEEAAALGFMAGVNAVLQLRGEPAAVIGRHEGYIGVMIDDLVTRGTDEPYRMFTSRAERRLLLRQDNARFRMRALAERIGVVAPEVTSETRHYEAETAAVVKQLHSSRREGRTLAAWLQQGGKTLVDVLPEAEALPAAVVEQVEVGVRYEGYIRREEREAAKMASVASLRIPPEFDYMSLGTLRYEAREKLTRIRPEDLGQASRIPGLNPPDIAILSVMLKRAGQ